VGGRVSGSRVPISQAGTGNRGRLREFRWYLACRHRWPEQQDRLPELRGATRCRSARAARPCKEHQRASCGLDALFLRRTPQVRHEPCHRRAEWPNQFGSGCRPSHEEAPRRSITRRRLGAMVVEPFEVQGTSTHSLDPLTQGPTCHAMLAGDRSERFPVGHNLADGRERHLDVEPLARHRVERQHALPPTARRALGYGDSKPDASRRGNQIPMDTAASEPERFRRACSASSPRENLVAVSIDHGRVAGGVDSEDDGHRTGSLLRASAFGHSQPQAPPSEPPNGMRVSKSVGHDTRWRAGCSSTGGV
jgi:hypothetical protein